MRLRNFLSRERDEREDGKSHNICFRVFVCFYSSRCTMMIEPKPMVIEPKFGPCDFFHKLELGECTVEGSSRWDWIGWESRNFLRLKICQVLTIKSQIQKTRVWESGDPTHMSSCIWYSGEGSSQTQILRCKIILFVIPSLIFKQLL